MVKLAHTGAQVWLKLTLVVKLADSGAQVWLKLKEKKT